MYKVPIMPYIKLNLEKSFYMSELWAFKIGANMIYNFGMEFDTDNLRKNTTQYTFDEYKFSSLSFEVFFGFGLDALNKVLVLNYNVLPQLYYLVTEFNKSIYIFYFNVVSDFSNHSYQMDAFNEL